MVKNINQDFSTEDKNELAELSYALGINTCQNLSSNEAAPEETITHSWPIFTAMLTFFSIFFFIFAFALRKGNNMLIPLAFFFQAWAFLLAPIVLIRQNVKLKSFVVNNLKTFQNEIHRFCPLERFSTKVYPYAVAV